MVVAGVVGVEVGVGMTGIAWGDGTGAVPAVGGGRTGEEEEETAFTVVDVVVVVVVVATAGAGESGAGLAFRSPLKR